MKVIALAGAENTGKSHTINIVYAFLIAQGYRQIPCHFRILGNPVFEDVFDILEKGGKKVGFVGMGDYVTGQGRSLKSLLEELNQKGCDVAICACRSITRILADVQSYSVHHVVPKTPSMGRDNDRIVNVGDAQAMILHI